MPSSEWKVCTQDWEFGAPRPSSFLFGEQCDTPDSPWSPLEVYMVHPEEVKGCDPGVLLDPALILT